MTIKAEDLVARGYEISPVYGATKRIGFTEIFCGYYPFNQPCVSIRFKGLAGTIATKATTLEDIEHLERLLGEADLEYDFDDDEEDEDEDDDFDDD